jgi:hypothetical protein
MNTRHRPRRRSQRVQGASRLPALRRAKLGWGPGLRLLAPLLVLALTLACLATTALADGSIQGSITSALWARENVVPAVTGERGRDAEETRVSWYQYGRLSTSLYPESRDGVAAQAYVSGRWRSFTEPAASFLSTDDDLRVYQAYVDLTSAATRKAHLRIGRQYLPHAVGFWRMDGARLRARLGSLTATVAGGKGALRWASADNHTDVLSGTLSARAGRHLSARVGAFWAGQDLAEDVEDNAGLLYLTAGGDLSSARTSRIHRIARTDLRVSADVAYNPLLKRVAQASARTSLSRGMLSLGFSHRYDTPQFAPDSIFTVFAVEARRENTATVEVRPETWWSLAGRHTDQKFDDGSATRDRVEARFFVDAEAVAAAGAEWLTWEGVRRRYGYVRVQKYFTPHLQLALSNALSSYRFTDGADDDFGRTVGAEARLDLHRDWSALVRVERNRNTDYANAMRVFGYLRTSFGTRTGGRP